MSKTHRLTPEQWQSIERYADDNAYDACFLELRARIEALEASAACPHVRSSDEGTSYCALAEAVAAQPADSLLDRVAEAVCDAPNTHEGWRSEARAALRVVAAWLRSELISRNVADLLENEANR